MIAEPEGAANQGMAEKQGRSPGVVSVERVSAGRETPKVVSTSPCLPASRGLWKQTAPGLTLAEPLQA